MIATEDVSRGTDGQKILWLVAGAAFVVAFALAAVLIFGDRTRTAPTRADLNVRACLGAAVQAAALNGTTAATLWDNLQECASQNETGLTPTTPAGRCVVAALSQGLAAQVEEVDNTAGLTLTGNAAAPCEAR